MPSTTLEWVAHRSGFSCGMTPFSRSRTWYITSYCRRTALMPKPEAQLNDPPRCGAEGRQTCTMPKSAWSSFCLWASCEAGPERGADESGLGLSVVRREGTALVEHMAMSLPKSSWTRMDHFRRHHASIRRVTGTPPPSSRHPVEVRQRRPETSPLSASDGVVPAHEAMQGPASATSSAPGL